MGGIRMKRKIIIALLLVVCLGICGCGSVDKKSVSEVTATPVKTEEPKVENEEVDDTTEEPEVENEEEDDTTEEETPNKFKALKIDSTNKIAVSDYIIKKLGDTKKSFTIKKVMYKNKKHYGKLDMPYPQLQGNKDYSKLNKEIYKAITMNVEQDEKKSKTDVEMTYEVKTASDSFVSIMFSGMGNNRNAAHPYHFWGTINYDLKENKPIRLTDVTTVDENLLKISKGLMKKQFEKDIYEGIIETNGNTEELISSFKTKDALFYFKNKKLCVGYTIQAVGFFTDFVTISIKTK